MSVATCNCGALTLTCEGPPLRVSVCYCRSCQRRTGSAFGVQARFAQGSVTVEGEPSTYVFTADTGNEVTFSFCGVCGSTTHWRLAALPGMVAVAVGAFADPDFAPPTVSIYEDRRHPWVCLDGIVDRYD